MILSLLACRVELGPPAGDCPSSAGEEVEGEVWIYTSMYPEVLSELELLLREAAPKVEAKFFQAGSEKLSQRLAAEWAAGGSPACVVATSDPFWVASVSRDNRLRPYLPKGVLRVPRELVDPDGHWVTVREGLVVLGVADSATDAPSTLRALAHPQFRGQSSTPDPLSSGSALTAFATLEASDGFDLLGSWRANDVVSAGGNGAVLTRIESGERPFGMVLLENLLASTGPSHPVFPLDGAIRVPGPAAILADCPNPVAAEAVMDLLLSDAGQALMVRHGMYPARAEAGTPLGAPALSEIVLRRFPVERLSDPAPLDSWLAQWRLLVGG